MYLKSKISIFGLGKLGAPIAAACAKQGFKIIGVDINNDNIKSVNQGKAHINEPLYKDYLIKYKKNIHATLDYNDAIIKSSISFIIVPTPSLPGGGFTNSFVISALKKIGASLKQKKEFHVVAIVSTVMPGSLQKDILPIIEKTSGKISGKDFGICYNPSFVALGNVISNFLNPDFVLIGSSDLKSSKIMSNFYNKICLNNPKIITMNHVNAEITKIALNTFITTKISYANMLSELCEKIPGANIDTITHALGNDSRIGNKYLKGGPSYGGPCFPRDNKALIYTGNRYKTKISLAYATDKINSHQFRRIYNLIISKVKPKDKIAIIGIAYRNNTDVIDESLGLKLAQLLIKNKRPVTIYDPQAENNAKKIFGNRVKYVNSIKECIDNHPLSVITLPFKEINSIQINKKRKPILIDCWRIIKSVDIINNIKYYPIGIGLNKI